MAAELTLGVLLFLLVVYLPGNLVLVAAGRRREERTVSNALFYGAWILGGVLLFLLLLQSRWGIGFLSRFAATLGALSRGGGPFDVAAAGMVFGLAYGAALAVGLVELAFVVGFKPWPFSRLFGTAPSVRLRPNYLLREIFIRYRRNKVIPYVRVRTADGRAIAGECLRFSWDGEESVLVRDGDDPARVVWVPLDGAWVEFLNLGAIDEAEAVESEVAWRRKILDGILPGYGTRVFGPSLKKD
jgi:hypothetical protein